MNKESIAKLLMKETVAFVTETGDEVIYGSEYHINELDELVNEYIDHFDSQGWSLYPRLFEGSLSEWREEGK